MPAAVQTLSPTTTAVFWNFFSSCSAISLEDVNKTQDGISFAEHELLVQNENANLFPKWPTTGRHLPRITSHRGGWLSLVGILCLAFRCLVTRAAAKADQVIFHLDIGNGALVSTKPHRPIFLADLRTYYENERTRVNLVDVVAQAA
jgi:hypothetical protein